MTEQEQAMWTAKQLTQIQQLYKLSEKMRQDCALRLEECTRQHQATFDLIEHLTTQKAFSLKTFGPGDAVTRYPGLKDHITKELAELAADPTDLEEWIDVVLLAFDGAWRTGASPRDIAEMLQYKQTKNENRTWPRWEDAPLGKAIEHIETSPTAPKAVK